MGELVEREWIPRSKRATAATAAAKTADGRDRRYRAYLPDELGTSLPHLTTQAEDAAAAALFALVDADERIGSYGKTLNYILTRLEANASCWLEGVNVEVTQLPIAEILNVGDTAIFELIANAKGIKFAFTELADAQTPLAVEDLADLHETIVPFEEPGLRTSQTWVGGSTRDPLRAEYVPAPETEVERLVEDLTGFVSATGGNPVTRAAIALAQFEAIRPFYDANGRIARALVHAVLRRAGVLDNLLIPVSDALADRADEYFAGLVAFRADPAGISQWVTVFANAVKDAVATAVRIEEAARALETTYYKRMLDYRTREGFVPVIPRSDALLLRILNNLISYPTLTLKSVLRRSKVTLKAVHRSLHELEGAGILRGHKNIRMQNDCYYAAELYALLPQRQPRS